MAASLLGLGWLGWATRKVGKAGLARPICWISAQEPISNTKFLFFFKSIF
jgi:hypothetical protein